MVSTVGDLPVGSALTRLRRAVVVCGAAFDGADGDLELSFDNGRAFLLRVAGNGESLAIR